MPIHGERPKQKPRNLGQGSHLTEEQLRAEIGKLFNNRNVSLNPFTSEEYKRFQELLQAGMQLKKMKK